MPDVPIVNRTTTAAPKDYTLPQSQEILLKAVRAEFDGTGAATSFLPALQLVSDAGDVMFTCVLTSTSVAAGGSASVSWFPLKKAPTTAPAPSPNPLGTLWAWWDFSDTTTITADGSGNINTIKDKTGNGHDAGQGTASQRPAQSTLNGLNCGLFNSASQTVLIASGWTSLFSPFTYFVVWTQTIASSAHYLPGPVGGWEITGDDKPPILFDNFDNSHVVMEAGAGSILIAKSAPYTQQLATMIFNNGSSSFRLNGTPQGGTTNEQPITNVALGSAHWPQVNNPPDTELMDGKIGEVLIYSGALVSSQFLAIESYLKTKWATP